MSMAEASPVATPVATWNDRFQLVTAAAAAVAAFATVLVLLGAVVLAGQLTLYELPWVVVLPQVPQTFLGSIAVIMVVGPLLAIAAIYALIALAFHLIHESMTPPPAAPTSAQRFLDWLLRPFQPVTVPVSGRIEIDWGLAVWAALWTVLGLFLMLAAHYLGYGTTWDGGQIGVAALAAFIGWLAGSVLLMAIRTSEPTWRTHTHLLVVSTFMALA